MSIKKTWTAIKPDVLLGGTAALLAIGAAVAVALALGPRATPPQSAPAIAPVAQFAGVKAAAAAPTPAAPAETPPPSTAVIATAPAADAAPATPAAKTATAPAKDAAKAASGPSGEAIYTATCAACHAAGVAGAPKPGDKAAWAPRLAQGLDGLVASVKKGKGIMPPKGGNAAISDAELAAAVAFMANQSGAAFKVAAATAAPAPAAVAQPAAAKAEPPTKADPAPSKETPKTAAGPSGEAIYTATCAACHAAGVAGAPKPGDKAAWAPRLTQGLDGLVAAVKKGKGIMPPKGGNAALSDAELAAAVAFMANQSGAAFKVAAAKAAPAAASAAATPSASATATKSEPPATVAVTKAEPKAPAKVEPPPPPAKPLPPKKTFNGQAIYAKTCAACHAAGVNGAPRVGNIGDWAPRFNAGAESMLQNALAGKGAMPPRGGNAALSEDEVRAALEYMLGQFR